MLEVAYILVALALIVFLVYLIITCLLYTSRCV